MLDVVERAAREDGHALVRVDGRVPAEERHARVERFQRDPDIPLALLTTQVGGLGLTLTAADRVVIYDPSWNPAADSQSVDRAYRIGQTRDVVVYRLVTCGTVEEKVYRRQVFKGGLSRAGTGTGTTSGTSARTTRAVCSSARTPGSRRPPRRGSWRRRTSATAPGPRSWRDSEAPMVRALGAVGLSDHDLLFSKEDTTKAGEGASTLKGGGAFGGGGSRAAAAAAAAAGKARARGRQGRRDGRASTGWGGDAQLGGSPRQPARRWPRRPPRSRSRQRPKARPRRSRSRAALTRAPRRRRPRTRPSARRRRSCARCACRRRSRRRCWTCPAC